MYELQYVPLALPFFLFLVGLFVFLVILIQVRVLQYAYAKLGLSSSAALLLLLASLIGSYFNIPIAELPEREVRSGQVVDFFGMRYVGAAGDRLANNSDRGEHRRRSDPYAPFFVPASEKPDMELGRRRHLGGDLRLLLLGSAGAGNWNSHPVARSTHHRSNRGSTRCAP